MMNLPNKNFMALLGSPVEHSKSPIMHNEAFKRLGMDFEYVAIEADEDSLEATVKELVEAGIYGFNCTMPVKNKMYTLCDECNDSARLMQAVNTVKIENGKIVGYNTDGVGFVKAVESLGFPVKGSTLTVLGTGGVAKAICTQLALDGAKEVFVFGRPGPGFLKMRELLVELKKNTECTLNLFKYDDKKLNECIKQSSILANATKVGMVDPTACVMKDFSALGRKHLVYDVIYEPAATMLLKQAKAAGSKVKNGEDMLFYQGKAAFEIWTGKEMPEEIKELVVSK